MLDQRENWVGRPTESLTSLPEHIGAEMDDGRGELLKHQRTERQQAKGGDGRDLPQEFGNLSLTDDGGTVASARRDVAGDHSAVSAEKNPHARTGNRHARAGARTMQDLLEGIDCVELVHSPGEIIRRDVEPAVHELRVNDTLEAIARQHLGAGASAQEVRLHISEIERLNKISNSSLIPSGTTLMLPGHTSDGGFVTWDEDGARRTEWSNGGYRVERSDGTGYVHTPGQSNGFTERHWGPRQQDNYTVRGRDRDLGWKEDDLLNKLCIAHDLQAHENDLQHQLSHDLRRGRLAEREEQDAIVQQFQYAAKMHGSAGDQEVLDRLNGRLITQRSRYRLRLDHDPSTPPNQRRLRIVDGRGRETDHVDFTE